MPGPAVSRPAAASPRASSRSRPSGLNLPRKNRTELVQVLDVMAQRRKLNRAREERQQLGQIAALAFLAQGDRHPQLTACRPAARAAPQRRGELVSPPGAEPVDVRDDQPRRRPRAAPGGPWTSQLWLARHRRHPGRGSGLAGLRRWFRPRAAGPASLRPRSPCRASQSPEPQTASTSWHARSHRGPEPTMPGRNLRAGCPVSAAWRLSGSISLTVTTPPHEPAPSPADR